MKIKYFIQLVFIMLLLGACQEEEKTIVQNQDPKNIIPNSPLANLISRVAQNPTAKDNVLDSNSCFSVQLPVTVVVNSQNITVTNEADYQLVKDAKDAYSTDNDIVYFNYPITVKFQNFSTQVVTNYTQLEDVIEMCGEDDGFDEIDCVAINYPIKINVYDSNNQVANTITIQSNSQLFNYIATLSSGIIAAIVYPISVTDSNGQDVVVNSNTELETFVDSSIDDCEDSGSNPNPPFTNVLTSGSWYVSYFYDDADETSDYNGYEFTFNASWSINVTYNSSSSTGTWSTYVDDNQNKIELDFEDSDLGELKEDWIIVEYTETTIHLKHVSGGGGGTDYLYFTKN